MVKKLLWLFCFTLIVGGCSQRSTEGENGDLADRPSYEIVYAEAAAALENAEARRNAWSKTGELLQDSRVAFAEGRVDDAIYLATEAKLQAQLAVAQADHEKEAWRSSTLEN